MGLIDGLKNVAKTLHEIGKREQYKQILDAQQELLKMQSKISQLEQENLELKKENIDLKSKLKLKGKRTFERNSYWIIENGDKKEGPYCTSCWDGDDKQIRIQPEGNPAFYRCPKCQNSVEVYPERDDPPTASVFTPRFDPYE